MLLSTQISTLILKVDFDCHQCYKKIRKILCKLQDQERIRTISYDDESSTIAIVGPFDPHKLSCKIRCKGGKVVKDIQIMDGGKPARMAEPPLPISNGKQKSKEKPKEKPPVADPPPPAAQPVPPDREISALVPAMVEEEKPKERPAELEPPNEKPIDLPIVAPVEEEKPRKTPPQPPAAKPVLPADVTPMVEIPSWPVPPPVVGPAGPCGCSCCAPCYQGYYGGCRCCHGGRVYGYAVGPPAECYGGAGAPSCGAYRGCQLFSEEDPTAACSIM